jgi:hypothetical protein
VSEATRDRGSKSEYVRFEEKTAENGSKTRDNNAQNAQKKGTLGQIVHEKGQTRWRPAGFSGARRESALKRQADGHMGQKRAKTDQKHTLGAVAVGNARARRKKLYNNASVVECDELEHQRVWVGDARVWKEDVTVCGEPFRH